MMVHPKHVLIDYYYMNFVFFPGTKQAVRKVEVLERIGLTAHAITAYYYMACVCSRYNARSDWPIEGIILP